MGEPPNLTIDQIIQEVKEGVREIMVDKLAWK